MVLQNKYKAKASRRYNNNAKASENDAEPGSSKPGYRQRFANRPRQSLSANGRGGGLTEAHSKTEDDDDEDKDEDSEGGSSVTGSDQEDGDAEFPSLAKAATLSDKSQPTELADDPSNPSKGKYARRKLGESKMARLERVEAAKDPRIQDDEEPEPEVDISRLVARVAALGDSAGTQAGVSEEIARSRGQHESVSDVENDIDHSLAYLHDKERQRQKAKGRGGGVHAITVENSKMAFEALSVDANGNEIDLEALQKEKEKADAARALKARFQGHGIGERQRSDGRSRTVPSIQIGPHIATSSTSDNSSRTSNEASLLDGLTADTESTLAKERKGNINGETASVHASRLSFSTTFGRRKPPLAGIVQAEQLERPMLDSAGRSNSSAHRFERINSFLASLNDRSIAGQDPSVFSLSSNGSNGNNQTRQSQPFSSVRSGHTVAPQRPYHQTRIHSTPGELGRLESFLDDMLG